MKNSRTAALVALACAFALPACGNSETDAAADPAETTMQAGNASLQATVEKMDEVSTAYDLVADSGLKDPFEGAGSYTVFLPDNEAFAAIPKEELERLKTPEGRPELIAFLRRHIAVGAIAWEDLDKKLQENGGSIQLASVSEEPISIRRVDGKVMLGGGDDAPSLTGQAQAASNGVVYVIDGLIGPEG